MHNQDSSSTLCKLVSDQPVELDGADETDETAAPVSLLLSQTDFNELLSCNMRTFVARPPCWTTGEPKPGSQPPARAFIGRLRSQASSLDSVCLYLCRGRQFGGSVIKAWDHCLHHVSHQQSENSWMLLLLSGLHSKYEAGAERD